MATNERPTWHDPKPKPGTPVLARIGSKTFEAEVVGHEWAPSYNAQSQRYVLVEPRRAGATTVHRVDPAGVTPLTNNP